MKKSSKKRIIKTEIFNSMPSFDENIKAIWNYSNFKKSFKWNDSKTNNFIKNIERHFNIKENPKFYSQIENMDHLVNYVLSAVNKGKRDYLKEIKEIGYKIIEKEDSKILIMNKGNKKEELNLAQYQKDNTPEIIINICFSSNICIPYIINFLKELNKKEIPSHNDLGDFILLKENLK
jgi:hypothetical protein